MLHPGILEFHLVACMHDIIDINTEAKISILSFGADCSSDLMGHYHKTKIKKLLLDNMDNWPYPYCFQPILSTHKKLKGGSQKKR